MRLIKADPIVNGIAEYLLTNAYLNDSAQDALEMVGKWVNEAPTVEAKPVVNGEWVRHRWHYKCSVCGNGAFNYNFVYGARFCPICGAKMVK